MDAAVLAWWGGFLLAFVLTCVIEVPAYLLGWLSLGWLGRAGTPLRPVAAIALAVGVNLITHPLLWAATSAVPGLMLIFELGVVAVEGLIVALVIRRRSGPPGAGTAPPGWSWLVALGVNALSVLAGSAIMIAIID